MRAGAGSGHDGGVETKDVEVECPCCATRILVDVRTGRVLRSNRPAETDETGKRVVRSEDWDVAQERVRSRQESAEDRFDAGLSREKSREQDLDDLFRRAEEKLADQEDAED